MPDIRLVTVSSATVVIGFDWLQTATNDIDETQQLASAVLVALNTDATADASDVLPDLRSSDRRGWWGDLDAAKIWGGWPIGSKLWLLTRAKMLDSGAREGATTTRVESYIRTALQPFIDQRIVSRISVSALKKSEKQIVATIVIYRGPKAVIQLEYQPLWTEIFP